jgi:YegS/Rv2252/BmrU family lipid kinase
VLPTFFIVNPHSGNGNVARIIPLIGQHFEEAAVPFEIYLTKKANDATAVAREISGKFPVLVAVGGDGTVNELVNGMGPSNILGVLPTGSGNDFSKMLQLPHGTNEILQVIAKQKTKLIDLGHITAINSRLEKIEKYFVNSVGIGLDAKVAYEASKLPMLRGLAKYVVSARKSIFSYSPAMAHVSFGLRESHGKHLLIAIGNGKSAGGGFYLTPDAILDDGLLDICLAKDISVLETLKIFPFVLKGKHGRFDKIEFGRAAKLNVKGDDDLPVHVDGEVVGLDNREIAIDLKPRSLRVIVP